MIALNNKQLGSYKLIELIGKGGMAEVWLANQLTLNRHVALKIIPETYEDGDVNRLVERFSREAHSIAQLDHPNILPVIDYGNAEGYLYLVTPYVPGGNLQQHLRRAPLERETTFNIFEQLLAGLNFAHRRGIIHRDLKPGNVLLYDNERAVIADFGVAKFENDNLALTQPGMILGSPEYMAPEQFMGEAEYRSDLYSLGIILYQMLLGRLPFTGVTPWEIGLRHLNEAVPLSNQNLPLPLELFLAKALQKQPEDRFADASDMLSALRQAKAYLSPVELSVASPSPDPSQPTEAFPTKVIQNVLTQQPDAPGTLSLQTRSNPADQSLPPTAPPLLTTDDPAQPGPVKISHPLPGQSQPKPPDVLAARPVQAPPKGVGIPRLQPIASETSGTLPHLTKSGSLARPRRKRLPLPILLGALFLLLLAVSLAVLLVMLNPGSPKPVTVGSVTATTAPVTTAAISTSSKPTLTSEIPKTPLPPSPTTARAGILTGLTTTTPATPHPAMTVLIGGTTGSSATVSINLKAENGTGATGKATITDAGNGLIGVTVSMVGLGLGQHGLHINQGRCETESPEQLVYKLQPLDADSDFKAELTTVLKADFATITNGKYYLDVLNYYNDVYYSASCGNIGR